jgi:hypothetical protein
LGAYSLTERFELTAGIVDFRYHDRNWFLRDVVLQPRSLS